MHDKFIEGFKVIDLISQFNLTDLLESEQMDALVTSYWKGSYETKYFMNTSFKYWLIS